ncbi:conserved hypothetical protein [Cellulomonas flavigena DSM 20109]|uniref:DUF2933 domain-containing protein n=1 Tax=Cellulomonas flavigena (strain ATCC 482 / DSM 20109 / BCRC 11376 / JCM 18109 / NBRC 3775 / NCIMB 8073 / NRS 134) TaxID=446466 RepID=D5UE60_CELFN|nr:DUF2933 domain-containing protein [Cellulomonas flavigena]ADG76536.1 conserved hypothetical protein [Cellulomonas flavigena DSM 20109]
MNHSGFGHLKWMALTAAALFGVLLLLGNSVGDALRYAVLLACPLMMVAMMFGPHSGRGGHGGSETGMRPREDTDGRVDHHHSA